MDDEIQAMQLGIIIQTSDPERVWNAFRFANTALDAEHDVETYLINDGVEAPGLSHDEFDISGELRSYTEDGGRIGACGTCLDSRGLTEGKLRPRATLGDYLRIVEESDKILTFG